MSHDPRLKNGKRKSAFTAITKRSKSFQARIREFDKVERTVAGFVNYEKVESGFCKTPKIGKSKIHKVGKPKKLNSENLEN